MTNLKLDSGRNYVIKSFNFWIFHVTVGYIGIKKVSLTVNIKWGW